MHILVVPTFRRHNMSRFISTIGRIVRQPSVGRILAVVVTLAISFAATAQEMRFLALGRPGQASISVDRKNRKATIVDLGDINDVKTGGMQGESVSSYLTRKHITTLAIVCSHPHRDHMGGIIDFVSDRSNFYSGNRSRFKKVLLIDNFSHAAGNQLRSLSDILHRTLSDDYRYPQYEYRTATRYNALSNISSIRDDVTVMTIPYEAKDSRSVHDHSVVTLTVLHTNKSNTFNTILDPDDASTDVMAKVADQLSLHGVSHIDTLVAPHHGSDSNDHKMLVDRLHPTRVIFTANYDNKHGHPDASVALMYAKALGRKNVLFTGSDGWIDLSPEGVTYAKYVAADPQTWSQFVTKEPIHDLASAGRDKVDISDSRVNLDAKPIGGRIARDSMFDLIKEYFKESVKAAKDFEKSAEKVSHGTK